MRYFVRTILISLIHIILLTACTEEIDPADMEGRLKVIVNDGGYPFAYGNELSSAFPNVQFEVEEISQAMYFKLTPGMDWNTEFEKRLKQFHEKEQADLYFLRYVYIKDLLEEGRLLKLDTLIENDQFDVENIHPNILEAIKNWGDGQIYGLSPTFRNYAIYYNKDLFELHGVPEPHDQMTWGDVLRLAKRFPTEDSDGGKTYGFAFRDYTTPDISALIRYMGLAAGLQQYNVETKQVTMQGEAWLNVVEKAVDAFQSGTVKRNDDEQEQEKLKMLYSSGDEWHLQLMNRSAMVFDQFNTLNTLVRNERSENSQDLNWGMVTVPINPQYIDEDPYSGMQPEDFIAISSETDNLELAWEVVKYINGDEFALKKSKIIGPNIQLFSRTDLIPDYGGNSMEPLYKLKQPVPEDINLVPSWDFINSFNELIHDELDLVIAEEQSAVEALEQIQNEGQILIMR